MKPKTLAQFKAWLATMGASLTEGSYTHHVEAPRGYVWAGNDLTSIAIHYATNSQAWLSVAIREAVKDCALGLRKCTPAETDEINFSHAYGEHSDHDDPQPSWEAPSNAPGIIKATPACN